MKKWKQITAFVLTAVILVSAVAGTGASVFAATQTQYLAFDGTDFSGWAKGADSNGLPASVSTGNGDDSAATVTIPAGKADGYQIFETYGIAVQPNTTYTISYRIWQANVGQLTTWISMHNGTAFVQTEALASKVVNADVTDWTEVTGTVTTGAADSSVFLRIMFFNQSAPTAEATAKVDDLTISTEAEIENPDPAPGTMVTEYLALNGEFVAADGGWIFGSGSEQITGSYDTTVSHGEKGTALRMQTTASQGYGLVESANISIRPNTTYTIRYYIKQERFVGATTYITAYGNAYTQVLGGNEALAPSYDSDAYEGWKEVTGTFTTESDTINVNIRITVHSWAQSSPVADSAVLIDDLTISCEVEAGEDPEPDVTKEYLAIDGTFDNVSDGVLTDWTETNEHACLDFAAENGALKVSNLAYMQGGDRIVSEAVSVKPGVTYDIAYTVKTETWEKATGYITVYDPVHDKYIGGREDLAPFYFGDFSTTEKTPTATVTIPSDVDRVQVWVTVHSWAGVPATAVTLTIDDLTVSCAQDAEAAVIPASPDTLGIDGYGFGFMRDEDKWAIGADTNGLVGSVSAGYEGTSALTVTVPVGKADGYQIFESPLVDLKPHTIYTISYAVSQTNIAGLTTYLTVYNSDWSGYMAQTPGGAAKLDLAPKYITTETGWVQITDSFVTGAADTSGRVRLTFVNQGAPTAAATVKIDDLVITEAPFDGSFDYGDKYWVVGAMNDFTGKVTADADGDNALSFTTSDTVTGTIDGRWVSGEIPVTPGETYMLKYRVKKNGTNSVNAYVQLWNGACTAIGGVADVTDLCYAADTNSSYYSDWTWMSGSFTVNEGVYSLRIAPTLYSDVSNAASNGGVEILYDDFRLYKVNCTVHTDETGNGKCDICDTYLDGFSAIAGGSLVLGDQIQMKVYLENADFAEGGSVNFYLNGDLLKTTAVGATSWNKIKGTVCYDYTVELPAKNMADNVIIQIEKADGSKGTGFTYSVKKYGEALLQSNESDAVKAMAKAMLNYGATAQVYFDYESNTGLLANEACVYSATELTAYDLSNVTGMLVTNGFDDFLGSTLILKDKTSIRLYFSEYHDTLYEKNGQYYVELTGIGAGALSAEQTITVGTASYKLSVLSLAQKVIDGDYTVEFKNLMKTLVLYSNAAEALV